MRDITEYDGYKIPPYAGDGMTEEELKEKQEEARIESLKIIEELNKKHGER